MRAGFLLLVACSSAASPSVAPRDEPRRTIPEAQLVEAIHARWLGDPARAANLVADAGDVGGLAELGRAELALNHVAAADAAFAQALARAGGTGTWQLAPTTTQRIVNAAFTPDGRWLASIDGEGRVEIYDVGSLRVVRSFETEGYPRVFEISPNGRWLATGKAITQIWDLHSGTLVDDFPYSGAITFSPASHLLAGRSDGGFVALDLATNKTLDAVSGPMLSKLVARGDKIYAVDNVRVITYDAQLAKVAIKSFPRQVRELRATRDGFAATTDDALVIDGLEIPGRFYALAVDGATVAAVSARGELQVFEGGKYLRTLASRGNSEALAFHPRGRLLASFGEGANLFDASTGKHVAQFARPPASVGALAFDARGDKLAVGSSAGHAAVWSLSTGAVSTMTVRPRTPIQHIAFGPDGEVATSALDAGSPTRASSTVDVFDKTGARRWSKELEYVGYLGYRPNTDALTTVSTIWKDDSSSTMAAQLWKRDGTLERTLDLVASRGFLWNRDGTALLGTTNQELVTTGLDGTTTRMELRHSMSALHPDGKRLAAATQDGKIAIWDLAAKAPTRVIFDGNGSLADLGWTPDGNLATASHTTVSLWDPSTGERVAALVGASPISALAIRPDGRVLATGHHDGGVTLWSIASGTAIATLYVPGELVAFVTTPDGAVDGTLADDLTWSTGTTVLPARAAFAHKRVPHLLATRLAHLPPPRAMTRVPPPVAPACFPNTEDGRRSLRTMTIDGNTLRTCIEHTYMVRKTISLSPPLVCFDLDLATGKYAPHTPTPREALGIEDAARITTKFEGDTARVCKDADCRDVKLRASENPESVSLYVDAGFKLLAATYPIADTSRTAVLVHDVATGKRVSQFIAHGDNTAYQFLDETLLVTSTPCAGPCSSSTLFDVRKGRELARISVNTSALSTTKVAGDVWAFNDWDSTGIVLQNVKTGRVVRRFELPKRACTNEPDSEYVSCEGITLLTAGSKLVALPAARAGDVLVVDAKGKLLADYALPICQ